MYLDNVLENNPKLMEIALQLHQQGKIPPNSWIIDLDTIVSNAQSLAKNAKKNGLTPYLMSKQHNRNPYVNALALSNGLNKIVAVDSTCALLANRYQLPLGHVGHLNQIPRHLVPFIVAMRPEVITVYNIEHARWIDQAAADLGIIQDLLIRVSTKTDIFYDGQEGGFDESEIPLIAEQLLKLKNVRLVGVTSFPCLRYNEKPNELPKVTPNMHTIIRAAEVLKRIGIDIKQINAPGNTSSVEMALLKKHGATHIEPGNALLGTTPSNAFNKNLPEQTAFIYLTEISHFFGKHAYGYGGGVYHTNYSNQIDALIGSSWKEASVNRVEYVHDIVQGIDYHMQFNPRKGQTCEIGDSVLLAYRTQMHMTRSYIAPISGISGKRELKLHYLFDNACNAIDANFQPVDPAKVRKDIDSLIKTY